MATENGMDEFYEKTKDERPHKNVVWFVKNQKNPGVAVDLGCGAGRDSILLLQNEWTVHSFDLNDNEHFFEERLTEDEKKRFTFHQVSHQDVVIPKCDLVIANFSMQYLKKEEFKAVIDKIHKSLNPGGKFLALLWGDKDPWAQDAKDQAFLSYDELKEIFKDKLNIDFSKEWQQDLEVGDGTIKHGHMISVVTSNIDKDLTKTKVEKEEER